MDHALSGVSKLSVMPRNFQIKIGAKSVLAMNILVQEAIEMVQSGSKVAHAIALLAKAHKVKPAALETAFYRARPSMPRSMGIDFSLNLMRESWSVWRWDSVVRTWV